jgi:adhesin/invasin
VTGSVIFGSGNFKGTTGDNGIFTTTVQNSRPGTFKARAFVDGTSLSSNTEVVTFTGTTTETPDVATIELIADPPQLDSEGWRPESGKSVIITAILRNSDNNLVPNAKVNFTVDSGEIQPVQVEGDTVTPATEAISDNTGRAYARLTTQGNPNNRIITVTATVPTTLGDIEGPVESTIEVEVRGTVLTISGPNSLTINDTAQLNIELKDSAGNGIKGQTLVVESALGNLVDNPNPVTDTIGQATVTLTAQVPGQDTITVGKDNVTPAILTISISDDNFILRTFPQEGVTNVSLNQLQEFVVSWSKSGIPQVNQQINLATTRGELSSNSVLTDFNGEARFTVTSTNVGSATITANVAGGPSAQLNVKFTAKPEQANSMVLQATPSTIGVNTGEPEGEKQISEVVAIVRADDNLVPGLKVNFSLNDPTGGYLSSESKVTDDFGRASVQYIAGNVPSSSEGVVITATVEGGNAIQCSGASSVPPNGCQVRLTVALKEVFVSLGTGNKISELDSITYSYPFKVLVTDINGAPVPGAKVVLSLWPEYYLKGYYSKPEPAAEGETQEGWSQVITLYQNPANAVTNFRCLNEDENRNGMLDPGEDINSSGRLDPGGVATFASGTSSNTITIETGSNGFGDFSIYYFKENANWVAVMLTARTEVTGSEGTDATTFELKGMASDYSDPEVSPPGITSPFGVGGKVELDAETGLPVFNGTTATCADTL